MECAVAAIQEAAEGALKNAAVGREDITLTVAGIGGIDWPGDDVLVKEALQKNHFPGEILACNDAVIAFYSGTMCSHGAVICAGTGMNGAFIDKEGGLFVYGDYME